MAGILDLSNLNGFDWNKGNIEHIKKHKVNFRECEAIFFNKPLIVNRDETHSQKEERFRVYGYTNKKRLLFIILTVRNNKIRIVSARDQNSSEKREFLKTGGEK